MSTFYSYAVDAAYAITNCMSCFPSSPNLKINGRSFKMLRLLGEGGFSYVYLVHPSDNPAQLYALKKIRCPFGQESVSQALREVEAYALFKGHPNIITSVDHAVVSDKGAAGSALGADGAATPSAADAKTVYILLPYYPRGNLQDAINANLVNHTRMAERRLMVLVLGVCRALRGMHRYKVADTGRGRAGARESRAVRDQAAAADAELAHDAGADGDEDDAPEANSSRRRAHTSADPADEHAQDAPLLGTGATGEALAASQSGVPAGAQRAYAHRDIKPGNIMISNDGRTPILMDLGSLAASPTPITTRSQALAVQDAAAEHSTLPYRAPELFDVRVGSTVDTKVDIWALGCTVYACLVGASPFERRSDETGGSLTMCVLGGDWRWPDEGVKRKNSARRGQAQAAPAGGGAGDGSEGEIVVSEPVKEVVAACLRIEPAERPDVDRLIELVQDCIAQLPAEDGE